MATADTETRTALQELLDERQRYQGWLRALEQRRGTTPAHVYERVHMDYTLRLERVMQRLRERAEQLSATIEGMQSRLQTLRSREADRSDERNEYELRAAVGELSPDEWDRRRTDADRELASIADDRRSIEEELAELQRIVAMTREQPSEPEPPAAAPSAAPEEEASQAPPQAASQPASPATPQSTWAPPSEHARASQDATTTGGQQAAAHDAPSHAGEHPLAVSSSGAASPSIDDFIAEWPLRHMDAENGGSSGGSSGGSNAGANSPSGAQSNAPSTAPATATWHPAGGVADLPAAPAAQAPPTNATPADLHAHHVGDGRRDMDKTLKCPECGAMNYATEWYCERCGGELASF